MHHIMYALYSFFLFSSLFSDEWKGIEYAENSSVQLSHAERLLKGLSLKGDESILDIGCGDGKITALLSRKVLQGYVVGIDPSDSMLEKSELTRRESELVNLTFQKGAVEDFTLDQRFDHILAIHVLHWVKDQERALENILAHLKPQGQVHFILAPSKEGLPFHNALQKTLLNWKQEFTDFNNPQQVYDMETYRKLMVKSGFHINAMQYLYHESIHESKEKLGNWIKQWQPHVKYLPVHQQANFLNELLDNYVLEIGQHMQTTNSVRWGEYVLIVEAKKM